MLHSICTSASLVVALTVSAFSCHPPKRPDNTISFSREEFEQIAASDESYGYLGSGYIQRGARLGVSELQMGVVQVIVNRDRHSIKIAGYVVDDGTRDPLSYCFVAIGTVVYYRDEPHVINAKEVVLTGSNGRFEIEADIDPVDNLFIANVYYLVKVYEVSRLVYPHLSSSDHGDSVIGDNAEDIIEPPEPVTTARSHYIRIP